MAIMEVLVGATRKLVVRMLLVVPRLSAIRPDARMLAVQPTSTARASSTLLQEQVPRSLSRRQQIEQA